MRILGLSAFQRDSAAALLVEGELVAAAQEERFTRRPQEPAFPRRAIRSCLASARIEGAQLDHAVFHAKPLRTFERLLARALRAFPGSARAFSRSTFQWLGERLWIRNLVAEELGLAPGQVLFVEQPRALLAHAFFASPFEEAALLLVDDVCEWSTTVLAHGQGGSLRILLEARHPHSLGLFVSAMTQYLGFVPGEEEHKLAALAACGEPRRLAELEGLFGGDGALFTLVPGPFAFDEGDERLFTPELERRLGPARAPGAALHFGPLDAAHADLAASVQRVVEERVLTLARELARRTGCRDLCLAGSLAENPALVARLAGDGPFRNVFVPPAPGKAGSAVGAAWLAQHALGGPRGKRVDRPCAPAETIDERAEPGARELGSSACALDELFRLLARGELVGWARGALELGRPSLGRRVALVRATAPDARARLLAALQHDEAFLPACLALPAEAAEELLELPASAALAARSARVRCSARGRLAELAPGALARDGRVWPLVVEAEGDPELHALLQRLGREAGAPLVLLTDLALRGAPPVRDEAQAVELLARSRLAALVAGTRLYARG